MGRVYIALLSIHNGFSTTLVDTGRKGGQQWITETLRGIDTNADIVFDAIAIISSFLMLEFFRLMDQRMAEFVFWFDLLSLLWTSIDS